MLVLKVYDYDNPGVAHSLVVDDKDCYCTHEYNGFDTLTFSIETQHELYSKIIEEVKVDAFSNRFVVKKIDEHSDLVTVTCNIDVDDWKKDVFIDYRRTNSKITSIMSEILPSGWLIIYDANVNVSKRTTVEYQTGTAFRCATALEILDAVSEAYSVVFNFDSVDKIVGVINPNAKLPTGEYFIEGLNLQSIGYNGDSTSLATRVYAYGKKDEETGEYVTIESVNDGKPYVEDLSYCNKVISASVVDERYTIPENLKEYAESVLAGICRPVTSYQCDASNFVTGTTLYSVVTLVDKRRKTRLAHQCIKHVEYNNHFYDKLTLSADTPSIESLVKGTASQRDLANLTSTVSDLSNYVDTIAGLEIDNNSGYFRWLLNANNSPIGLYILIDSDELSDVTKLYRWTNEGLKFSSTGVSGTFTDVLTNDGKIGEELFKSQLDPLIRLVKCGTSHIESNGYVYVYLDTDFYNELTNLGCTYTVFVQPLGGGTITSVVKNLSSFVVNGDAGVDFDWCIHARRITPDA